MKSHFLQRKERQMLRDRNEHLEFANFLFCDSYSLIRARDAAPCTQLSRSER
ncbi:hypothetical protein EXN66_Car002016 [Channa argus]|uniref:Uncharacterized protein n=1 Tax=Channa argus TaxID=215402 RepID=A0A6G1P895_CHAAH|nr:hypothetical protein EXN66_Car002016 [Channa argus]